jgi:hypothetical protein
MNASRLLAILTSCTISLATLAQSSPAPVHPSSDALSNGRLTVWISSRSPTGPNWTFLLDQLRADYPHLQLEWQPFQPDSFLPALNEALASGHAPDVVFAQNIAQQGPLIQRRLGRLMAGAAQHGDNGWWTVLNGAQDPKVAEAFIVWLEQAKNWHPSRPATQLMSKDDETQVALLAQQTMRALSSSPARYPPGIMDPSFALSEWNRLGPRLAPKDEVENYSTRVEQVGGNAKLAFVELSTLEQGQQSFGLIHSVLVFRKESSAWKLLFIEQTRSMLAEELVERFDAIGLTNDALQNSANISLLEPGDGDRVTRFPRTELAFKQDGGRRSLIAIESQYATPGKEDWSPSRIDLVTQSPDSSGTIRMPAPFGIGVQPHRWRVWSIDKAGEVALSEWRTVNFVN